MLALTNAMLFFFQTRTQFDDDAAAAGAAGGLFGAIIGLVAYLFVAFCLMRIADKAGVPNGWFAFVPILNFVLILQIADKPLWWILLLLIPIVNFIILFPIWGAVAERINKPAIVGYLTPFLGIFTLPYMAFA